MNDDNSIFVAGMAVGAFAATLITLAVVSIASHISIAWVW